MSPPRWVYRSFYAYGYLPLKSDSGHRPPECRSSCGAKAASTSTGKKTPNSQGTKKSCDRPSDPKEGSGVSKTSSAKTSKSEPQSKAAESSTKGGQKTGVHSTQPKKDATQGPAQTKKPQNDAPKTQAQKSKKIGEDSKASKAVPSIKHHDESSKEKSPSKGLSSLDCTELRILSDLPLEDQAPQKALTFLDHYVPCSMTSNELMEQFEGSSGMTELFQMAQGRWIYGVTVRKHDKLSDLPIAELGWNEARGSTQEPVWLFVYHAASE